MATYTDQLFSLFSKGLNDHSPEVKELAKTTKHMQSGLHPAFSKWNKLGKLDHYPHKEQASVGEAPKGREGLITGPGGTLPEPLGQGIKKEPEPEIPPDVEIPEKQDIKKEPEPSGGKPPNEKPEEKPKNLIPAFGEAESETFPDLKVAGEALPFKVNVSVKTVALYELAATDAGDNLSFGKFIDICVEDYFLGRGVDLGYVKLGGKE